MPCYFPLDAYIAGMRDNGRRDIKILTNSKKWIRAENRYVLHKSKKTIPPGKEEITLPCGRCIGCKLERSRQWAVRCVHESQLHSENCFITLTFAPWCPLDGTRRDPTHTLFKDYFQKFIKRLRKRAYGGFNYVDSKGVSRWFQSGSKIRYFHAGEYGDQFGRPHHHAVIFGFDFPDKRYFTKRGDNMVFVSDLLRDLWPFGFSEIGNVTFESAAYVARYCTKKVTGLEANDHYGDKEPEYVTMSRRPGIALDWFRKYYSEVYSGDFVTVRGGKTCKPPRYYDGQFELIHPQEYALLKEDRAVKAKDNPDNSPDRLAAREKCQQARFKMLERRLA